MREYVRACVCARVYVHLCLCIYVCVAGLGGGYVRACACVRVMCEIMSVFRRMRFKNYHCLFLHLFSGMFTSTFRREARKWKLYIFKRFQKLTQ